MRKKIEQFCTTIGLNPMLVQGSGGNISWKDKNVLWVKASGMRMADAQKKDIFVPVDLKKIKDNASGREYSMDIQNLSSSDLRPSIETILHGLMPHKIVLHLHAIEILPYLVLENYADLLNAVFAGVCNFSCIDYKKPGPDLAQRIYESFLCQPDTDILFLQNHGIVIGGGDIDEVGRVLENLTSKAKESLTKPTNSCEISHNSPVPSIGNYSPVMDDRLHSLALNETYFIHVCKHWALYPDHVVFLGSSAFFYDSVEELLASEGEAELVFVKGVGVYTLPNFMLAKLDQLKCYYDVVIRLGDRPHIRTLTQKEIHELVNWDLEKYRIKHAE